MTTYERRDVVRFLVQAAFYLTVACLLAAVCGVAGAFGAGA